MIRIRVHDHALKHGCTREDIHHAWDNRIASGHRESPFEDQVVAIGSDKKGRHIQMVAVNDWEGILIFHAMSPPTRKVIHELESHI